jgi:fucose permease
MLGAFALFGLAVTASGAVMPQMLADFGWTYTTASVVLCASALGYLLATFTSGLLIGRWGPRRVILAGMLIQAAGLGLFGMTASPWVSVVLKLLTGAGLACTEVVGNLAVVRSERPGKSWLMNVMHGGFAAGAVAAPAIVWGIAQVHLPWQAMYVSLGAASLVLACTMAFMPFSRIEAPPGPGRREACVLNVLANPLVVLGSLILMLYVGIEIGVTQWVAEYCVVTFAAAEDTSATLVSFLWLGMLAGRIGVSVLYRGTRPQRLLASMTLTTAAATAAILLAGSMTGVKAAVFVAGLGLSAVYPVVMTLLGRYVRHAQPLALATASTGGGVGAVIFPLAMGALADLFGIAAGLALSAALTAVMLALVVAMGATVRGQEGDLA